MEADDNRVMTIYRTNGLMWAAFALYADELEEPCDIFGDEQQMLTHAQSTLPHRIEYRPQELGCETSEEELVAVVHLAAIYDARMTRNQHRLMQRHMD